MFPTEDSAQPWHVQEPPGAIHAVVRADQQLVDVAGEFVRYGHGRQATGYVRLLSPVKEVKNPASHFLKMGAHIFAPNYSVRCIRVMRVICR
jgi:hypothetical protein